MSTAKKTYEYLQTNFNQIKAYTFIMKVKDLVEISYVAIRGESTEEGAIQRVLNPRRISDIKSFILKNRTFFNSFILNWTQPNSSPNITENGKTITLEILPHSAQVIDGQHRIAGFKEAIKEDESISDSNVIVTMCIGINTSTAAEIFLNINTEQKPVDKSLVYDLFGEISKNKEDPVINRAVDIAKFLNDDENSPFYKCIKFPGSPRGTGSIQLSTVVGALKEHLKPNTGIFARYKIEKLNSQKALLLNFFLTIQYPYEKQNLWDKKNKNPFIRAVGFNGAIDFLAEFLIKECFNNSTDFTRDAMKRILSMEYMGRNLLTLDDVKGLDGKTAKSKIQKFLEKSVKKLDIDENEYKF